MYIDKRNKEKILVYLFICLMLNSCVFNEKKKEDGFPFQSTKIESIGFNVDRSQNYENLNDSLLIEKVNEVLYKINSNELIKGRNQHGATNLYSLKLSKEGNDLLLFVNRTKDNEITIDFFEEDKEDNFNYFLGCLYKSDNLYRILNDRLIQLKRL